MKSFLKSKTIIATICWRWKTTYLYLIDVNTYVCNWNSKFWANLFDSILKEEKLLTLVDCLWRHTLLFYKWYEIHYAKLRHRKRLSTVFSVSELTLSTPSVSRCKTSPTSRDIRTLLRVCRRHVILHPPAKSKMALSPNDPNSFSRPEQCRVTNIDIILTVNFANHILKGFVGLDVEKTSPDVPSLVWISYFLITSPKLWSQFSFNLCILEVRHVLICLRYMVMCSLLISSISLRSYAFSTICKSCVALKRNNIGQFRLKGLSASLERHSYCQTRIDLKWN